jgi:hypothetical protein
MTVLTTLKEFTMPTTLVSAQQTSHMLSTHSRIGTKFGREKELELIRNVIRHTSTSFSRISASVGYIALASAGSQDAGTGGAGDDHSDTCSSQSVSSNHHAMMYNPKHSQKQSSARDQSITTEHSPVTSGDVLRRPGFATVGRAARSHAVIIVGPPG